MKQDDALSSVVSEMLLLALVLILIPSVTITLMHQLPGERIPTVNIKMHIEGETVTLYHKGGDYLLQNDMMMIVYHKDLMKSESLSGNNLNFHSLKNSGTTFDLGDSVSNRTSFFDPLQPGDQIQLVTKNAVIFSGVVP